MSTATHGRLTAGAVTIVGSIEWPCLARALFPRAAHGAEATVTLAFRLSGTRDRLQGRVTVTVSEADGSDAPSSLRGPSHPLNVANAPRDAAPPRTLLERPTSGTLVSDRWTMLELRTEGGPSVDALVAADAEHGDRSFGERPRPGYVRTDLPLLLGLEGGRYGAPRIFLRVEEAEASDVRPVSPAANERQSGSSRA
ncbi:MAG: hypothetical protein U0572_10610 [Phycisphaerales bacterium]